MSIVLRCCSTLAVLVALGSSCFDGDELTEGLRCAKESHCGPGLDCINAICQNPADVCADTVCPTDDTDSDPSNGAGENTCAGDGDSCAAGEVCCSGSCIDFGDGLRCGTPCGSGTECADTCCCQPVGVSGQQACVATSACGSDASCTPNSGCAALGSSCYGDYDCCGGLCLADASGQYSCYTQ
jgi:hypothetical protein